MELIASIQLGDIMFSSTIVLRNANKATKLFTKIKMIYGSVVNVPFYYFFIVSVEIKELDHRCSQVFCFLVHL
jgi:hypothetical protein